MFLYWCMTVEKFEMRNKMHIKRLEGIIGDTTMILLSAFSLPYQAPEDLDELLRKSSPPVAYNDKCKKITW